MPGKPGREEHPRQEPTALFPAAVSQPVQYGAGLKAMVVYLSQYQLLAYQRPRERILTPCAAQLHPFEQASKARLHDSPAAHFDETGMRLSQDLHWLHACSTEQLTCYHFDTRRGTHAMQAMGVPPWFKGTAVHDHRKPYYRYDANHALCNAHHLRELIHAREQHGQRWAQPMIACLLEAKAEVAAAIGRGREALTKPRLDYYQRRYSRILRNGRDELPHTHPPPGQRRGRRKQHPAKHPHDRLTRHKYEVLAYRYDFSVPFDTNQAERDPRMGKVKQKISGCFRSLPGAQSFAPIRGYVSTARKHSLNVFDARVSAVKGQPYLPQL